MENNDNVTTPSVTHAVVTTALMARNTVDKLDFSDQLLLINNFLVVLEDAGLVTFEKGMKDMDMIKRGMYAANLYLAACAMVGQSESDRLQTVANLEATLANS